MATTATVGSRCVNYPIQILEGSYRKFVARDLSPTQPNTFKHCVFNWRASLVPAAAVIPTPRVYLNVAAVKKLVVEFLKMGEAHADPVFIRSERLGNFNRDSR
jgi:hypothetical protein